MEQVYQCKFEEDDDTIHDVVGGSERDAAVTFTEDHIMETYGDWTYVDVRIKGTKTWNRLRITIDRSPQCR
jgi:hypothetical protein